MHRPRAYDTVVEYYTNTSRVFFCCFYFMKQIEHSLLRIDSVQLETVATLYIAAYKRGRQQARSALNNSLFVKK